MTVPQTSNEVKIAETLLNWTQTGELALQERISELELQLENTGWQRLYDVSSSTEFSLSGIKRIAQLARLFYLKNPIIQRGVDVQTDYTFGRGVPIKARDEDINLVVQTFIDDLKNQVELTSHIAMLQKDRELRLDGNLFLVFFVHEATGSVRVRSFPLDEIDEIVTNPEDSKEPWYYRRVWSQTTTNIVTGEQTTETHSVYYRDWQYAPLNDRKRIGDVEVANGVVFHVKTGGFSNWKYGVSDEYASLDWAKAYKTFLENWATLMQAYARFAQQIKVKGGARAVASVKAKLATTLNTSTNETNPPPSVASTAVSDADNIAYEVVRTAGATTKAEEGRRLLLMVAAGQGLPETFYGDVSVGTLATAESLDRPTELKFSNRQEFWQDIWKRILWFVIECSVKAPQGVLRTLATTTQNEYSEEIVVFPDEVNLRLDVEFPEIISMSIQNRISAIIQGATLDGKTVTLFNARILTEWILQALGVDEPEQYIEELFPNGEIVQENAELSKVIGKLTEALNNASANS